MIGSDWKAENWKHPDQVAESLLTYIYDRAKGESLAAPLVADIKELYTHDQMAEILVAIGTRFNWKRL